MTASAGEPRAIAAADEPTFEQSRAIDAGLGGPFLVDAGAGTGKTFTLVQRAVKLVTAGALAAHELLIVTFTNKAANEIAERIARTFAAFDLRDVPRCTTFHAFAGDIVREFSWAGDVPFDARQIDDMRARVLFRRVWTEFLDGRLGADASSFPVGVRDEVVERDLAALAVRLRALGISIADFESRARFAARQLAAQTWGQTWERGKSGKPVGHEPKRARTPEQRRAEAEREERNVHVVVALLRRFDALLAREGVVTFGDVLARAKDLVDVPAVRARLRARIAHALVDEFQDTNPQQLAFLRSIFGDGLERVMAVGDIRQAIYGFNGADPEGIVRFGELDGCTRFPLTENRRSYQQILDAAHFALAAQADPLVPLDRGPLVARKGPASELAVRAETFGDGNSNVAAGRLLEARAVAREVDALLRDGIAPRAIALLVRSRTNARPYIDALRERGIAAKMHGGVGFFDAPEICDARAWMRFLASPIDRAAIVRVLQSRTFGYADGTIARLAAETPRGEPGAFARAILIGEAPAWFDARERERLELFRAMAGALAGVATERAPVVVRAIADWCGIDLAAAHTQPILAEQVRANLDKLIALAESFERERPGARLDDLVAELDEREALDIDEPEADVGLDRVSIVTVHGAKGLEWEYVFVVNVAKSTFPSGDRPNAAALDWHEPSGALALIYSVEGVQPLRWLMRGDIDVETGERRAGRRGNGEEARLFYVAMTRAKTRLYVTGPLERDKASPFIRSVLEWGRLRGFDERTLALTRERPAEQPAFDFGANAAREPKPRFEPRPSAAGAANAEAPLGRGAQLLSYSAIAAHAICPRYARYRYRLRVPDLREFESAGALETVDGEPIEATFRPLDPARFGLAAHRALELALAPHVDRAPASAITEDEAAAAVETAGAEFGLEAREREALATAVAHAIEQLKPYVPLAIEARFELPLGEVVLHGAIDAIVRDPGGAALVIDYKTGLTPPAAHRLQLSLYARVARAGAIAGVTGSPRIAVLTVAPGGASLVALEPLDDAELDGHVRAAARGGDEPTPSPFCARCPYAGALCPEGLRADATTLA